MGVVVMAATPAAAPAAIQYYIHGTNWAADRRAAAVAAMDAAVGRYNQHGGFNKTINVYYEPGVPTADASYNGTLRFGGTWPNERVSLHEISHTVGVGTVWQWNANRSGNTWTGQHALRLVRQFDGLQANLSADGAHFWPYGLNYDNEASAVNNARHVAMVYAMRADMGLGPAANPSTAANVSLNASDALGESSFNHNNRWSDGHFAHAGAAYSTGNFLLRTPASGNSFQFAGTSLFVNNTDDAGGLSYKGTGTSGVITIDNLVLNRGLIQHTNGLADLFQLDGRITVATASRLRAKQGNIHVLASVAGAAPLTILAPDAPTVNDRYVRFFSPANNFVGDLVVEGRFELAAGANHRFVVRSPGESNAIVGPAARRVLLNGLFQIDLASASTQPGASWALVSAANVSYGSTFSIAGFTEASNVWTHPAGYVFSEASGILSVVPEPTGLSLLGLVSLAALARRRG
jgi:hypothetical protein